MRPPEILAEAAASPAPPKPRRRMPALDGLRGVAVLMVLLDHASDKGMRFFAAAELNHLGKFGVHLFFVLSAFLLTWQLRERPAADLRCSEVWLDYARRRLLRIYPLYAVVLLSYWYLHRFTGDAVVQHLLLRQGVAQFWTIPVEIKFYVLLPFLAVFLFRDWRKSWRSAPLFGLLAVAAGWVIFEGERRWSPGGGLWLAPNLAPFLFGSLAAVIAGVLHRRPKRPAWLGWTLEAAGAVSFLLVLERTPAVHLWLFGADPRYGKEYDPLLCGMLWSVVLLGVLHGRGWANRILCWLPLRYLGWISFSVYLWHKRYLNHSSHFDGPPVVRLALYVATVLFISTISYLAIEKPVAWWAGRKRATRQGFEP